MEGPRRVVSTSRQGGGSGRDGGMAERQSMWWRGVASHPALQQVRLSSVETDSNIDSPDLQTSTRRFCWERFTSS